MATLSAYTGLALRKAFYRKNEEYISCFDWTQRVTLIISNWLRECGLSCPRHLVIEMGRYFMEEMLFERKHPFITVSHCGLHAMNHRDMNRTISSSHGTILFGKPLPCFASTLSAQTIDASSLLYKYDDSSTTPSHINPSEMTAEEKKQKKSESLLRLELNKEYRMRRKIKVTFVATNGNIGIGAVPLEFDEFGSHFINIKNNELREKVASVWMNGFVIEGLRTRRLKLWDESKPKKKKSSSKKKKRKSSADESDPNHDPNYDNRGDQPASQTLFVTGDKVTVIYDLNKMLLTLHNITREQQKRHGFIDERQITSVCIDLSAVGRCGDWFHIAFALTNPPAEVVVLHCDWAH